jgi:hypothetical protein
VIALAYAAALLVSMPFLGAYSDYAHLVETAWYTHSPIEGISMSLLLVIIGLGALPILMVLGLCTAVFLTDRRIRHGKTHGLLLSTLGILALPWGGLHMFNAIDDYMGAIALAAERGVADPSNALLHIYGGYGLGVGVLWVATGVALFLMGRKLCAPSECVSARECARGIERYPNAYVLADQEGEDLVALQDEK